MTTQTSRVARSAVDADAQRSIVLSAVRLRAGREALAMTAAELAFLCENLDSYAFNRRLPELRDMGLIGCSGTRKEGRVCFVKKSQCMTWYLI